jgi:hypothetical protein
MALTYRQAGFVVVIDDFWDPSSQLSEYAPLFSRPDVHKVLLFPNQQSAHQRNLDRTGPGATQQYLDQGIHLTYQSLNPILPEMESQGWLVLDTTDKNVDAVLASILEHESNFNPSKPCEPGLT